MGTLREDDSIAAALFGSVRQRVLGLLFGQPHQAYYLRQITRAVDAGHGAVQRELRQLVSCGLVTRTRSGNQVFYQADEKAPVFSELRGLIMKTVGLADVLREALHDLSDRIEAALIYGSMAEGTHQAGSDVDLMVVGEVGLRELSPVLSDAQERLRREVNPVTISPTELRDRFRKDDHFIKNVLKRPKIFLIGGEDDLTRIVGRREADS